MTQTLKQRTPLPLSHNQGTPRAPYLHPLVFAGLVDGPQEQLLALGPVRALLHLGEVEPKIGGTGLRAGKHFSF